LPKSSFCSCPHKIYFPTPMKSKLRHLDLFSGIGGFSLGLEATGGFKTIGFSEIDPWCCAVLKKHWPKVKNYGDIRTIPAIKCDIITGGFPCQPFSCAGEQRGAADDRHLWPAMFEVIARCRPAWVICENVPGIINIELDNCCLDLEYIGYTAQPIIVPACAVDARHRRDRVWIVAYRGSRTFSTESQQQCEASGKEIFDCGRKTDGNTKCIPNLSAQRGNLEGKVFCEGERRQGSNSVNRPGKPIDADSESEGRKGRESAWDSRSIRQLGEIRQAVSDGSHAARKLSHRARNSRNGRGEFANPSRWPIEPGICRMVHGLPNSAHRLKALGNSILPQIPEILGQIILQIESQL